MSNWQYVKDTNDTVATRTNLDGSVDSCLASSLPIDTIIDAATLPTPEEIVAEIYIRKIQELGAALQAKFDVCCPCTIGETATHIQCCDLTDRTNLLAIEARARAFIAAGTPELPVKIRCLMNIDHYIPASDMGVLLTNVFDWAQVIMDNFHAHKDAIAAIVATINDLGSTQQQADDATVALSNYDVTLNW